MSVFATAATQGIGAYPGEKPVERGVRASARAARPGDADAQSRVGRLIFGVPARFMAPRLLVYVCTFALVLFGVMMVYSASSITSMFDDGVGRDATALARKQLLYAAIGTGAAVVIAKMDYRKLVRRLIVPIWVATVVLLALVFTAAIGADAYGATRWITFGGFSLQPSEFAKITVILTFASIVSRYLEDRNMGWKGFLSTLAVAILVPLVAILFQPDKGTTIICALTLAVMALIAGFNRRWLLVLLALAGIAVGLLVLIDGYARDRVLMAWNPWIDEFDAGYQLVQGQYAFSTGGLLGVGIGMSRQKYTYLPMADNDFIFAIIGEELGLVGTLSVLAVFTVLVLAAFRVARHAPDLMGRLIAVGCSSMIAIQLFVNIGGVLGIIPLSGKPVPFISSGGSSIISCLMLVGFIVSVSKHSSLPETVFDERRRSYAAMPAPGHEAEPPRYRELSLVGEATPRSARGEATAAGAPRPSQPQVAPVRLTVLNGGRSAAAQPMPASLDARSPEALRANRAFEQSHRQGRVSFDASGRRRIDLGPDAASRLRGR